MNYHELKKDAKIVDEVLLYLLKHNDDDISIDISRNEERIIFTFKLNALDNEVLSYMDKYIKADKEDRKEIRNRLAKIKADLNIRVSEKVEARLQSFVTDFPFADNNLAKGTTQTNELLRGIDEKIGYIAKRPTIGTIVMEQRNFEKLLDDE